MQLTLFSLFFLWILGFWGLLFPLCYWVLGYLYHSAHDDDLEADSNRKGYDELEDKIREVLFENAEQGYGPGELQNYEEILFSGDLKQKLELIGILAHHPGADSIRLLKEARNLDEEAVRILAANALQEIEDSTLRQIIQAQDSYRDDCPDSMVRLGLAMDEAMFRDLVMEAQKPLLQKQVFEYFLNAWKLSSEDMHLFHAFRAAVRYRFDAKALSLGMKLSQTGYKKSEVSGYMAELWFRKGDYNRVKETLKNVRSESDSHDKLYKLKEWWLFNETVSHHSHS
jgi:hypothetical protein